MATPTQSIKLIEKRLPIVLDRLRYLLFDLNTMIAYEEKTCTPTRPEGKFYWEVVLRLLEFHDNELAKLPPLQEGEKRPTEELKKLFEAYGKAVGAADVRMLIWAALHEYEDGSDEPHWDITPATVGRYLTPAQSLGAVSLIVKGHQLNAPTKEELGEALGAAVQTMKSASTTPPEVKTAGGQKSIELPAGALS